MRMPERPGPSNGVFFAPASLGNFMALRERCKASRARFAMPTYFFNVYKDKDKDIVDEEGTELTDLRAAIPFAVLSARSIAADDVLQGRFQCRDRIEIIDRDGRLLHTVRFDEAVEIYS